MKNINKSSLVLFALLCAACLAPAATAHAVTVGIPGQSASNGVYDEVSPDAWRRYATAGATVGLTSAYSGEYSMYMSKEAKNSSLAEIEYLFDTSEDDFAATHTLGDLEALSYDWMGISGDASRQPMLRLVMDADGDLSTTGDVGYLSFVYDGYALTGVWVTETLVSDGTIAAYTFQTYTNQAATISDSSLVLGVNITLGKGKYAMSAAVDNVVIGFASDIEQSGPGLSDVTTDFEPDHAVVPEPATLVMMGSGLLGLGLVMGRGRRRAAE